MQKVIVYAVGRPLDVRDLEFGKTARLFLSQKAAYDNEQEQNAIYGPFFAMVKWFRVSQSEADRILRKHARYLAEL